MTTKIINVTKKLLHSKVLRQTALILLEQQLKSQQNTQKNSEKTHAVKKHYSSGKYQKK